MADSKGEGRPVHGVVAAIVTNSVGSLLVVRQGRRNGSTTVALPGGHRRDGETLADTAIRECLEETGVTIRPEPSVLYSVTIASPTSVHSVDVLRATSEATRDPDSTSDLEVVSSSWLNSESTLQAFASGAVRHIAEPLLAQLAGHVGPVEWIYDEDSGYLEPDAEGSDLPIVGPGHYLVGEDHTERLGVPAQYLKDPETLTMAAQDLCRLIAPYSPDSIVGMAIGGLPLATECAVRMSLPLTVVEPQAEADSQLRTRGAKIGQRAALVDSTFHTGATIARGLRVANSVGGRVVVAGVAVKSIAINRPTEVRLPIPVHSLHHLPIHSWTASNCPLCADGLPMDARPARNE